MRRIARIAFSVLAMGSVCVGFSACEKAGFSDTPVETQAEEKPEVKKPPIEIDWVSIPAGSYMMGTEVSVKGVPRNEKPAHRVRISAFEMSRTEVTFEQYDAYCEVTGKLPPIDEGWGRGKRPVINVSYQDAKGFCEWVGGQLPTEAQWEYACRARTTTKYSWGDDIDGTKLNYNKEVKKTQEVGQYGKNAYGLLDMEGNVWEWCLDNYSGAYYAECDSEGEVVDPTGPPSGSVRIIRGGAWNCDAKSCRSAYRGGAAAFFQLNTLGFRVVRPAQ